MLKTDDLHLQQQWADGTAVFELATSVTSRSAKVEIKRLLDLVERLVQTLKIRRTVRNYPQDAVDFSQYFL